MTKPTVTGKPYQVEVSSATGTHTEHFSDRETAESWVRSMIGAWTNQTRSGDFEQYEHVTIYKDWLPVKRF